jgi:hypothetical protein
MITSQLLDAEEARHQLIGAVESARRSPDGLMTRRPRLGDTLPVRLEENAPDSTWAVNCAILRPPWTAVFTPRSGNVYTAGSTHEFWVYRIDSRNKIALLSDLVLGTKPIHARQRARYLAALAAGLYIYSYPEAIESVDTGALSELKGMFNRCLRQDQADWMTVYHLLQYPPVSLMGKTVRALTPLGYALRHGNQADAVAATDDFLNLNLQGRLSESVRCLEAAEVPFTIPRPAPQATGVTIVQDDDRDAGTAAQSATVAEPEGPSDILLPHVFGATSNAPPDFVASKPHGDVATHRLSQADSEPIETDAVDIANVADATAEAIPHRLPLKRMIARVLARIKVSCRRSVQQRAMRSHRRRQRRS